MNGVSIDFETANNDPASACAVGMAIIRDGSVVDTFNSLIRPSTSDFCSWNIRIHGITNELVADAPTFADIYPEIQKHIGDGPLIAHNAVFDVRVLEKSLQEIGQPVPELDYYCTLQTSRLLFPELPNHRLGTMARLFDIPLEHHNALSDAVACAQIFIRLYQIAKPVIQKNNVNTGKVRPIYGNDSTRNRKTLTGIDPKISEILCLFNNIDFLQLDSRFVNMRFVLTGEMDLIKRGQAIEIIEKYGGKVTGSVSKKTNVLIVGCHEWDVLRKTGQATTNKLKKAVEFQKQGGDIRLLNQAGFFELIR